MGEVLFKPNQRQVAWRVLRIVITLRKSPRTVKQLAAFDSRAGSIMFLAELLAVHYAPGGKYFGGSFDLTGVGVRYASDPAWARKVAGCMRVIMQRAEVEA